MAAGSELQLTGNADGLAQRVVSGLAWDQGSSIQDSFAEISALETGNREESSRGSAKDVKLHFHCVFKAMSYFREISAYRQRASRLLVSLN